MRASRPSRTVSVSVFAPEADRASWSRVLSIWSLFFIRLVLPYKYGIRSLIRAAMTRRGRSIAEVSQEATGGNVVCRASAFTAR